MMQIPRKENNDIDYVQLGVDIEHNMGQKDREEFWKKFQFSTDSAMADLGTYCRFKWHATRDRLAGNVGSAEISDKNADTVYERNIKPENRW
jgi:hypothetical protein